MINKRKKKQQQQQQHKWKQQQQKQNILLLFLFLLYLRYRDFRSKYAMLCAYYKKNLIASLTENQIIFCNKNNDSNATKIMLSNASESYELLGCFFF